MGKESKNEKVLYVKDVKEHNVKRIAKKVKEFKYAKSIFSNKVRIAPGTYIYTEKF